MRAYWLNEWVMGWRAWNISVIRLDVYHNPEANEVSLVLFGFGVQVTW